MSSKTVMGAALLSAWATAPYAATITHSSALLVDRLDFDGEEILVNPFNPNMGVLDQVELTLSAILTITAGLENQGNAAGSYELDLGSYVYAAGQTATFAGVDVVPNRTLAFDLGAYDDTLDFDGTSGATVPGEMVSALAMNIFTDTNTLDAMTGTEELVFLAGGLAQVEGRGTSRFAMDPTTSFVGETYLTLDVTYTYSQPTVSEVPLPAGLPLLAFGLTGLAITARRRS